MNGGAGAIFETAETPTLPFVHMATGNAAFNVSVAEQATFSTFDPGQDMKYYEASHLQSLFAAIAILLCNHFESVIMCEKLGWTEQDLIDAMPVAIITRGKEGSTLYQNGESVTIPACPVVLADPIGVGDTYRVGFLTAYRRSYALPACAAAEPEP